MKQPGIKSRLKKSVTLIELLMCVVLLGMVVLAFFSIDSFGRYHLITSEKRAKVQIEASYTLEHMVKYIGFAIGDTDNYPVTLGSNILRVWVDSNENGQLDPPSDKWVAYEYVPGNHTMLYCADSGYSGTYPSQSATGTCTSGWETLSHHIISDLSSTYLTVDTSVSYLSLSVEGCYNPDQPSTCGYSENPSVFLTSSIRMPSVSVR